MELKHQELTEKIIQCCFKVHNTLGFGFLEKVYENALVIELSKAGLDAKQQYPIQVYYEGEVVGDYQADVLVENKVILELKSIDRIADIHEIQLKNYLKATGIEVGLLINFGKSVEIRRKFNSSAVESE
jgi:GxxExxY protein